MNVKILKRGKLPGLNTRKGKCTHCGCVVQVREDELQWEEDRGQDYAAVKCPTRGCNNRIYFSYS